MVKCIPSNHAPTIIYYSHALTANMLRSEHSDIQNRLRILNNLITDRFPDPLNYNTNCKIFNYLHIYFCDINSFFFFYYIVSGSQSSIRTMDIRNGPSDHCRRRAFDIFIRSRYGKYTFWQKQHQFNKIIFAMNRNHPIQPSWSHITKRIKRLTDMFKRNE